MPEDLMQSVSGGDALEVAAETVEQVIEVVCECPDYTEMLQSIQTSLETFASNQTVSNELVGYLAGFGLFAVIVLLCYFGYKFFRMFF